MMTVLSFWIGVAYYGLVLASGVSTTAGVALAQAKGQ